MTDSNLQELLDQLHDELERTDISDEARRARLRQLETDLRERIARQGRMAETDDPLVERLQESIDDFETSHPQLTLMLSQMMTILSNAGI